MAGSGTSSQWRMPSRRLKWSIVDRALYQFRPIARARRSGREQIGAVGTAGAEVRQRFQRGEQSRQVALEHQAEHVLEAVDDEIALLEGVGPVGRPEYARQVEG